MEVIDGPRFAWRGLTVDVARTFLPVERLMRVVDMLSLYKLNVLHLHLTDDAGWRIEIQSRPQLTEVGAPARSATGRVAGTPRTTTADWSLMPRSDS